MLLIILLFTLKLVLDGLLPSYRINILLLIIVQYHTQLISIQATVWELSQAGAVSFAGDEKVGISQLFLEEFGKMGYPNCDKGCISGKCGEGATLCHHDFTNDNSPLWVNYWFINIKRAYRVGTPSNWLQIAWFL